MSTVFDHPWLSGLFGDAEAAAIWSPERQLKHMLAFEAAFTQALNHVGAIQLDQPEDLVARIASFQVDLDDLRQGTARDGLPVPALVSQLKQMAGKQAHAIHTGATSQDVIDTALSLTIMEFSQLLSARLSDLSGRLRSLVKQHGANALMGRTRMQAALPIKVADRICTWSRLLATHAERLEHIRSRVEVLQLGGAVGDRGALSPHATEISGAMAKALGLKNPAAAWHAARDGLAEYAGLLSLITGALGKMGSDFCLMAQQGVDEISMSGGGGSSAMPHKQNPVLAELLVTLARFNATQLASMHHALLHEQERSGAAWMLEWMILPEMAQATARSLTVACDICNKITSIGSKE